MEVQERNNRVVELLTRKDEIGEEIAALDEKKVSLAEERQSIEDELTELLGMKPNGTGVSEKVRRKCSRCGEAGHSVRTCPKKEE